MAAAAAVADQKLDHLILKFNAICQKRKQLEEMEHEIIKECTAITKRENFKFHRCEHCNIGFISEQELTNHFVSFHNKCNRCDKTDTGENQNNYHGYSCISAAYDIRNTHC